MWTLDLALTLIRELQPELRIRSYHVALGGGVLNNGESQKDLDLYIFPLDNREVDPILPYLERLWGPSESIPLLTDLEGEYPADVNFDTKRKFQTGLGRIDVFITHNGVGQ